MLFKCFKCIKSNPFLVWRHKGALRLLFHYSFQHSDNVTYVTSQSFISIFYFHNDNAKLKISTLKDSWHTLSIESNIILDQFEVYFVYFLRNRMIVLVYHLKCHIYQDNICKNFADNEYFQMKSKKFWICIQTIDTYFFSL